MTPTILRIFSHSGPPLISGVEFPYPSADDALVASFEPNHVLTRKLNGNIVIALRRWRLRFEVGWDGLSQADHELLLSIVGQKEFQFTPRSALVGESGVPVTVTVRNVDEFFLTRRLTRDHYVVACRFESVEPFADEVPEACASDASDPSDASDLSTVVTVASQSQVLQYGLSGPPSIGGVVMPHPDSEEPLRPRFVPDPILKVSLRGRVTTKLPRFRIVIDAGWKGLTYDQFAAALAVLEQKRFVVKPRTPVSGEDDSDVPSILMYTRSAVTSSKRALREHYDLTVTLESTGLVGAPPVIIPFELDLRDIEVDAFEPEIPSSLIDTSGILDVVVSDDFGIDTSGINDVVVSDELAAIDTSAIKDIVVEIP